MKRGLGKHTSIAGGLSCALDRAAVMGCTALQFFSRNPRGWAARPLADEEAEQFRETRSRYDLSSVTIHTNYLVNLAAVDPVVRERSIAASSRAVAASVLGVVASVRSRSRREVRSSPSSRARAER